MAKEKNEKHFTRGGDKLTTCFVLTSATVAELKRLARENDCSISFIAQRLLAEAMQNYGIDIGIKGFSIAKAKK